MTYVVALLLGSGHTGNAGERHLSLALRVADQATVCGGEREMIQHCMALGDEIPS